MLLDLCFLKNENSAHDQLELLQGVLSLRRVPGNNSRLLQECEIGGSDLGRILPCQIDRAMRRSPREKLQKTGRSTGITPVGQESHAGNASDRSSTSSRGKTHRRRNLLGEKSEGQVERGGQLLSGLRF